MLSGLYLPQYYWIKKSKWTAPAPSILI